MQYATSLPFPGDAGPALALADSSFTSLAFRITRRTPTSAEYLGPGMTGSRQSPLLGASRILISIASGQLSLEADLGGVERLARFVTIFPVALPLVLGLILTLTFRLVFGPRFGGAGFAAIAIAVGANALLWLILGPVMARHFRARTECALDVLASNLAAAGQAP